MAKVWSCIIILALLILFVGSVQNTDGGDDNHQAVIKSSRKGPELTTITNRVAVVDYLPTKKLNQWNCADTPCWNSKDCPLGCSCPDMVSPDSPPERCEPW